MRPRSSRRLFEKNEVRMRKRSLIAIALLAFSAAARVAVAQTPRKLALSEAEQMALRNHPRIGSANLLAEAAKSVATEARAPFYPFLSGNFTSVAAEHN